MGNQGDGPSWLWWGWGWDTKERGAECVQVTYTEGSNEVQRLKMKQRRSGHCTCSSCNVPEPASVNGL